MNDLARSQSPLSQSALQTRDDDTPFGALDRWLRARLVQQLGALRGGALVLSDALGTVQLGDHGGSDTLLVTLHVHDAAFYRHVARNGSVGAGESYMDGLWDCDDLVALVRLLVRNRDLLDGMETGLAKLGGLAMRALHALGRNTRTGSRRNIAAHYDLGNDLFDLFLDDNLMYSSAMFADAEESLEVASRRKLDRLCDKLALTPDDHVIEIGSGWGGFALHAVQRSGCRVTTTTISREQHERACERVAAAGLSDRITVLQSDYRDLTGQFDKLVSIEMIEAIGHQYLDTYFATCARLLKPDGLGVIQAITIEDHRYVQARDSVDFIKRFIFPGSFIPSIGAMQQAIARTDLQLSQLEDFGTSYALTLRHWRRRFFARLDAVRALGYPERFVRMWEFYLCYCEGGFLERSIGVVQMRLRRPGDRRNAYLPAATA